MIRKGLERKAGKGSCQLRYREGKKLPSSLHSQPAQPPRSLAVRPSPVIFSPPSLSRTIQLLRSRPLCALSNSYSSIWACWRPDLSDPARDLHSGLAFYSLPESARAGSRAPGPSPSGFGLSSRRARALWCRAFVGWAMNSPALWASGIASLILICRFRIHLMRANFFSRSGSLVPPSCRFVLARLC
jgi:hypothetical protein